MADENNNAASSATSLLNPPTNFRSPVWKYFGFRQRKPVQTHATCKICFCDVSYKAGNTSNMATHLCRKHSIDLFKKLCTTSSTSSVPEKLSSVENEKSSGQQKITDALIQSAKFGPMHPKAKAINKAVGYFIAVDMRPFSVVENLGFKHLLQTLEPRYKIPSRPYFSGTVLPELYNKVRFRVESELTQARYMAITTDSWTSRAVENYITFTAHFIASNWSVKNFTLQTRLVSESHTAEHLAQGIKDTIVEWKLSSNGILPAVTTDNASNIVKAAKLADISIHVGCYAHTINLAVQKGLKMPVVDRLLGRIRRIVAFFHKSTTASSILKSTQNKLDLKEEKLVIDVSTRWNSTYDMVSRYLEQQPAIFSTLSNKDVKKNVKDIITLSSDDVSQAEQLVELLKPFKVVTSIMCDSKHPTISLIHPMKNKLLKNLDILPGDNNMIKGVKSTMAADLKLRYTDPNLEDFLLMSSAMDPRFKSLPYLSDVQRQHVFEALHRKTVEINSKKLEVKKEPDQLVHESNDIQATSLTEDSSLPKMPMVPEVSCVITADDEIERKKPKLCALDELFGDVFVIKVEPAKSLNERINLELQTYETEERLDMRSCPLSWWNVNSYKYPMLAEVAKYFLGIPATSVASERVFSTAGDIVTAQRATLDSDNVDMLIFLKKNIQHIDS